MFWMRLRMGNSSRRVPRRGNVIFHVKHMRLPLHQFANSQARRDQSIAQPHGVQISLALHTGDCSGPRWAWGLEQSEIISLQKACVALATDSGNVYPHVVARTTYPTAPWGSSSLFVRMVCASCTEIVRRR